MKEEMNMLKQNKGKLLITTLITLIPMLMGIVLWERLPDPVVTHFGVNNEPDGWSPRWFAVFGIPCILAGLHVLCLIFASLDPKQKNIGKKPLGVLFWTVPSVSLVACTLTYAVSLGVDVNVGFIVTLLVGVIFIVFGNQLPRAKQNYTFGMRLPWTLEDEQNWNRTNRVAGWCMFLAGIVIVATSFWNSPWILLGAFGFEMVVPVIYSYVVYRRGSRE